MWMLSNYRSSKIDQSKTNMTMTTKHFTNLELQSPLNGFLDHFKLTDFETLNIVKCLVRIIKRLLSCTEWDVVNRVSKIKQIVIDGNRIKMYSF